MTDIKYFQLITGCPDEVDFPIKGLCETLTRHEFLDSFFKN